LKSVTSHRKVPPLKPQDHNKVKKNKSKKLKVSQLFGFLYSVRFSCHIHYNSFVGQSIHRRSGQHLIAKNLFPAIKTQIGGNDRSFSTYSQGQVGKQQFRSYLFSYQPTYFPIQNRPKIFPNKSSVLTSPVISPKYCNARLISMATKSEVIPLSNPDNTANKFSSALRSAS